MALSETRCPFHTEKQLKGMGAVVDVGGDSVTWCGAHLHTVFNIENEWSHSNKAVNNDSGRKLRF